MFDVLALTQQLGPRLRAARHKALLTAREAAEHLGVDHSMIVRYEHGETLPPIERLAALAAIYRVSPASLLLLDEQLMPVLTTLERATPEQISMFIQLLQQVVGQGENAS
jgi:transcriptional regulator with XRE-family HTH domain